MNDYSTDAGILLARLCLSAVFLVSGIHKALYFEAGRMEFRATKLPAPDFCLVLVIVLQLLASAGLVTGIFARFSALSLAVFTLLVTVWVHDFWNRPNSEEMLVNSRDFLANMAIFGGLLMVVIVGPGQYTLG